MYESEYERVMETGTTIREAEAFANAMAIDQPGISAMSLVRIDGEMKDELGLREPTTLRAIVWPWCRGEEELGMQTGKARNEGRALALSSTSVLLWLFFQGRRSFFMSACARARPSKVQIALCCSLGGPHTHELRHTRGYACAKPPANQPHHQRQTSLHHQPPAHHTRRLLKSQYVLLPAASAGTSPTSK
jgi:hypothetical protein